MPAWAHADVPATCPGPEDPAFGPVTTVTGSFDASMENSYVQVPFDVPAGTTGVRVRYCFDQPEIPLPNGLNNNTLDLSVYEPLQAGSQVPGVDELRGSSGGAVRDATIAVNGFSDEALYEAAPKDYVSGRTTRAFEPGPIPGGEWSVELGLAAISTATRGQHSTTRSSWRVDVQTTTDPSFADDPYSPAAYDESPVRAEPGWYAGDFHVHGEHEPGNALMRETFDYAFAPVAEGGAGLDFVQLVDHNNTVAYGEIGKLQPSYPDRLISRGTEVTTYRGHTNSLGSEAGVDFRDRSGAEKGAGRNAHGASARPPGSGDLRRGSRSRRVHPDQPSRRSSPRRSRSSRPSAVAALGTTRRRKPTIRRSMRSRCRPARRGSTSRRAPGRIRSRRWRSASGIEAIDEGGAELEPHRGDGLERLPSRRRPGLRRRLDPGVPDRRGDDGRVRGGTLRRRGPGGSRGRPHLREAVRADGAGRSPRGG